jgi:hypothetical protein
MIATSSFSSRRVLTWYLLYFFVFQLLIVAFDIVLATAVVPLVGGFYAKKPSPRAAFCSVVVGAVTRVVLEFVLPKDGFLIYPFNAPEFYDYGSAASANFPPFFDMEQDMLWNPDAEPCTQQQFEDYTGVDSLTAFGAAIIVYLTVQFLERNGKVLFTFPGLEPYDKMGELEARRQGDAADNKELDDTHSFPSPDKLSAEKNVMKDDSLSECDA